MSNPTFTLSSLVNAGAQIDGGDSDRNNSGDGLAEELTVGAMSISLRSKLAGTVTVGSGGGGG